MLPQHNTSPCFVVSTCKNMHRLDISRKLSGIFSLADISLSNAPVSLSVQTQVQEGCSAEIGRLDEHLCDGQGGQQISMR